MFRSGPVFRGSSEFDDRTRTNQKYITLRRSRTSGEIEIADWTRTGEKSEIRVRRDGNRRPGNNDRLIVNIGTGTLVRARVHFPPGQRKLENFGPVDP